MTYNAVLIGVGGIAICMIALSGLALMGPLDELWAKSAIRRYLWTPLTKWRRWDQWAKPKDTDSLQAHIDWYSGASYRRRPPEAQGFAVKFQTETSAFLVNAKWRGFSWRWFIFWWILSSFVSGGLGVIIYPLYNYFIKREHEVVVQLYVEDGKVRAFQGKRDESPPEEVDRVGFGRYILSLLLAGFLGPIIMYFNRRSGWRGIWICGVIFGLALVLGGGRALIAWEEEANEPAVIPALPVTFDIDDFNPNRVVDAPVLDVGDEEPIELYEPTASEESQASQYGPLNGRDERLFITGYMMVPGATYERARCVFAEEIKFHISFDVYLVFIEDDPIHPGVQQCLERGS